MDRSTPGFPVLHYLLQSAQIHVHCISDVIQPSYSLSPPPPRFLPSIFPSIRLFSNESALHKRWPKYWNFSFSISASSQYPELISFRMDWLDLLAVQGTLGLKASQFKSINSVAPCLLYGPALTSIHDHWKTID